MIIMIVEMCPRHVFEIPIVLLAYLRMWAAFATTLWKGTIIVQLLSYHKRLMINLHQFCPKCTEPNSLEGTFTEI